MPSPRQTPTGSDITARRAPPSAAHDPLTRRGPEGVRQATLREFGESPG